MAKEPCFVLIATIPPTARCEISVSVIFVAVDVYCVAVVVYLTVSRRWMMQ